MLPTMANADETFASHLIVWLCFFGMTCVSYFTTLRLSFLNCKMETLGQGPGRNQMAHTK